MAPRPSKSPSQVARVLLRLPSQLHRTLVSAAAGEGVSFNQLCVQRLALPPSRGDASPLRAEVLGRAHAVFGDRLRGVLVLGSWARGTAAVDSDIDVLVVLDATTPLTRDLYRAWDRDPIIIEGRAVDAHMTHLPVAGAAPTAVWCEAAVDGSVWYDRDGAVSRHLADMRRAIADGVVVRRSAHGQSYWKGAA